MSKEDRKKLPLPDDQIASHAIETLRELSKVKDKNFFLAVGFHKPHLPFVFPEEFADLYPKQSIHLPQNEYAPSGMPDVAWSPYGELRSYNDIHALNVTGGINTTLPDDVVTQLRRAYYSSLTYTDSLIGTILMELESLGLTEKTIVSFWGDHGWQLGEHGEWCKHTNFELATHAPMMIRIPGKTDAGIVTEELTEFVDLFPTLVEAAGLPPLSICPAMNASDVPLCREGQSLMPLVAGDAPRSWKDRVFSQYPRPGDYMGYTMRTDRYRYTEWVKFNRKTVTPSWNECSGVELYDHAIDPQENVNKANDKSYKSRRKSLSDVLHKGWRPVIQ